ncbi:nuclear RNA export factor 1/2 [Strigomonas culicis]|uniref:Nuclear RNA export factor 1/2 n=1 Tax=Strigomonas culicis TaxID=28005 RepID=S9V5E2_9TRYP|nr:nuclear RNA export factor 1/2 [Strigomonas culicis]|eukprot:EPY36299.1 nuclear RNA export factor 1/2 [Strigomonas culicis]
MAKAMEEEHIHVSTRALSLAGNAITDIHIAVELKKFVNLAEVDLSGNPVAQLEHYRNTFKKQLPWLLGLDRTALAVPPLGLPWPAFKNPAASDPQNDPSAYDDMQKHILQFVQQSILLTLEAEPGGGQASGVDAVSDHYALNASMTLSLTCPEAAVSTPLRTAGGGKGVARSNDVIREIVAFRLRQTEDNHNLVLGVKSQKVAMGRTQVCARLERWLYPKQFVASHLLHSSSSVVVLDNHGCGPDMVVGMVEPISVVTLHGVMLWRFRNAGPSSGGGNKTAQAPDLMDAVVMKRNFVRTLTVSTTEAGRWHIVNDMVTLSPFSGRPMEPEEQALVGAVETNVLLRDIHECNMLFSPATNVHRIMRYARTFKVPPPVVQVLCQNVRSDAELAVILDDVTGLGMDIFEGCASLVGSDPLLAVFVARLGNRYGITPDKGAEMVRQVGLNWDAVLQMALANPSTN